LRYGREREVMLGPDDLKGVPGMLEEKIGRIEKDKHFDLGSCCLSLSGAFISGSSWRFWSAVG
jgi:hypothetical protein